MRNAVILIEVDPSECNDFTDYVELCEIHAAEALVNGEYQSGEEEESMHGVPCYRC